jgi:hypothetical protein
MSKFISYQSSVSIYESRVSSIEIYPPLAESSHDLIIERIIGKYLLDNT